ncbi:MAG TPA: TraR/DksA family transcriptional regulator [Streptosporangiaceae bacterium]|nr:TraR/DksA family transcriptional regulator [Streptosporangiaceae bacterium]
MTATTGRRLHSTQTHTLPVLRCPEGNARAANRPAAEPRAAAVIAFSVPCWRAVLETRWTYWMSQVTELSLAFHTAAERIGYTFIGSEPELERLQRQIAAARRALVDIDHAAARLSTGRFGYCEQCGADIPVARLATIPEARYCPGCSSGRHDQPWVIQAWLLAVLTA